MVMFIVATAVAAIQIKYKDKMLFLREMIEKFLLLRDFLLVTLLSNFDAFTKVSILINDLPKVTER